MVYGLCEFTEKCVKQIQWISQRELLYECMPKQWPNFLVIFIYKNSSVVKSVVFQSTCTIIFCS